VNTVSAGSSALFPRIPREPRLSDKVAELLLQGIVANGLQPGDRLPSERELGEQFGVSRTVIREAVRALAAKGVIEARTGSGLRVAAVDADAVTESMRLFLRGHAGIDYEQVHEVRTTLEVQIAGLAAGRATAEDVELLRSHCDRMADAADDAEAGSREDVAFHRGVAEATHNPLFVVMLDSIADVMLEIRRATLGMKGRPAKGVRAHRQILARIAAHDAAGARDAMRKHLADSWRVWQQLRRAPGDGVPPA
jgi:GntR family transcriptional regulator, transcriptional repressor for pyruvate dehydrogenase complex